MDILRRFINLKTIKFYLIAGILLGIFLRFHSFGTNPNGLSAEEVSSAYESSLLKTGKDRWGIDYPVYFISWGSGQNTLYAYFSIPFIKLFGMNAFGIRFLSGLLGLLTLGLLYLLFRKILKSSNWALFGVFLYTLNPWHFILSRWSFEENPVPFFAILGFYLLIKSHELLSQKKTYSFIEKTIIATAWIPFSFLFYAYAMSLFIVPFFILFYVLLNYKFVLSTLKYHLISFGLFLFISIPFGLFILKNNIIKTTMAIEKYLPFSLPKMLFDRETLSKPFDQKRKEMFENVRFFYKGFSDGNVYNATDLDQPHYLLLFAIIGLIYALIRIKNEKKFEFGILVSWFIASLVVVLLFFMNLNRSMHLQTVIPIFIVIGIYFFISLVSSQYKKYFIAFCGLYFVFMTGIFVREYFVRYPAYSVFVKDFEDALLKAESFKQKEENVAVTPTLLQNYLYTLVFSQFSPEKFHKSDWIHANNRPYVNSFGHYYMLGTVEFFSLEVYQKNLDLLASQASNIYIVRRNEKPLNGQHSILYSNLYWDVYRCSKTTGFKWD